MTRKKRAAARVKPVRYRPEFEIGDREVVERSTFIERSFGKSAAHSIAFQLARRRRPPVDLMACSVYLQAAPHMQADPGFLASRSVDQLMREMLDDFNAASLEEKESLAQLAMDLACASLFSIGRPIYRIDPELLSVLATTELSREFPAQALRQWRDWCAWIDFDGGQVLPGGDRCLGAWGFLQPDFPDRGRESFVLEALCAQPSGDLYLDQFGVPVDGDVSAIIDEERALRGGGDDIRAAYQVALQAALYVISEGADIEPRAVSAKHRREGAAGASTRLATGPEWWEVGYRIGRRLREARLLQEQESRQSGRQPAPHIRRAHWHLYWTGKGSRSDPALAVPKHRWVHPAVVGADRMEGHELPPIVHEVIPPP